MIRYSIERAGSRFKIHLQRERVPFFELPKDFSFFDVKDQMGIGDYPDFHAFYFFRNQREANQYLRFLQDLDPDQIVEMYDSRKEEYMDNAKKNMPELFVL